MKTIIKFGIFLLIILLGFASIAIYWTFYKPLPDYTASEQYDELNRKVDIHWDNYGIPHVHADNKNDLYFALGYVHAQDRLWQMTMMQLAAEGRFAEFFGSDLIAVDKHQRILGFWETAQRIKESVPDSTMKTLKAYSKGVNSYVNQHRNKLPIQFSLAGMQPLKWKVTHTIALTRLFAWELNINWWHEVNFGYLESKLTKSQLRELFPRYDPTAPTTLTNSQTRNLTHDLLKFYKQDRTFRKRMGQDGSHVGSNAWVVDGSMTRSGYPMLAGDPHLGLNMPGKWYEVHLNLNGKNLSGATVPGAPAVILGQNDFMAWTLTNMMADDTDFFIELQNPDDRSEYVVDSVNGGARYKSFDIQREVIKVKEGEDRILKTRATKHGPVISDIYPVDTLTSDHIISMQWTGHQVSHEISSMLGVNWARSFDEFQQALTHFKVPGQNMVYADKTGNIALFSIGRIPIRDHSPLLFRKGWDPSYDWQRYIPFDQLPRVINPDRGWIANANNKLTGDSYPYYIASFWEPPSRIRRINQYLVQSDTVSETLFKGMQNDLYSHHARRVTREILPVLLNSDNERFKTAITYLQNWNYKYERNAAAASILDVFYLTLTRNTLKDELGAKSYKNFVKPENLPVRVMDRLLKNGSTFFDDIHTSETETRADIIRQSMDETLQFLTDSLGPEPYEWHWENIHTINLRPPLFGEAANKPDAPWALRKVVNNLMSMGPYAAPGHGMSVNNGHYSWHDPFKMTLGPSIRRIVNLADLGRTQSILATGQSENPLSHHFGDQTTSWLEGTYKYLYQDSTLYNEVETKIMKLNP